MRAELSALLNPLPIPDALHVVRAFSYFSHLANLAEDVHQNRRRRAHALSGSPPQQGSIEAALAHLTASGVGADALAEWFAEALVSPVLTAHPTEVQRKSILDCERELARLLRWRDRTRLTPDEGADWERDVYRQVLTLWQTAMLRLSKLTVRDEIDNGLAYYRYTFLAEVPRLYETTAALLARMLGAERAAAAVPAHGLVDRRRPRRQSVRRRGDARLRDPRAGARWRSSTTSTRSTSSAASCRCRRASCGRRPRCCSSPSTAQDANPHRQDEPYRQALTGHLRAARRDDARVDRAHAGARIRTRNCAPTRRRRSSRPTST